MDIAELSDPIAVWKAVEGDPFDLITLLRSDEPIRRPIRDALADYLAGDLKPIHLTRGRPSKSSHGHLTYAAYHLWLGHDVTTPLGFAGFRYDHTRRFIRSKGWHLNNPGWADRLKAAISTRHGIELEKFINYLSRSRPKPDLKSLLGSERIERRRREIAREVRRAEMGRTS